MAHHGASKNTRLTRLMKKRNAIAPSSSINIAHHRQTPDVSESNQGAGQDDTGQGDLDEVFPVPQHSSITATTTNTNTGDSDKDVPKVLATVVNVVNSDIPHHSTDLPVPGLTMPSGQPIVEASLTATAFPAYSSLTADTPSLTVNSLTSATSSTSTTTSSGSTASATASRPLISSGLSSPAQTSSPPSSASNSSGSSSASSTLNSNSSRISRPNSKPTTSLPFSITSSNSTSDSTSSSTTSSLTDSSSSSSTSTTTTTDSDFRWINGYGSGGTKTGGSTGPTSTGTDAAPPPTGGPTIPPTTSKIVGGVVGSVAGAVMLVILALFLLKRRTAMRKPHEALPSSEMAGAAAGAGAGGAAGGEMTSRFSRDSMLATSFFTPAFMRKWRDSSHTDSTLVSASSERGFQKISGRKIPSVLTSGGDGYGGGYESVAPPGSEPSSTPRIPGSPVNNPRSPSMGAPPPSIPHGMPLDVSYTQETAEFDDSDTIAHASPSSARPVVPDIITVAAGGGPVNLSRSNTDSPGTSAGALSPPMQQQQPLLQRPDLRTSHSFDGSRGSRFTEDC